MFIRCKLWAYVGWHLLFFEFLQDCFANTSALVVMAIKHFENRDRQIEKQKYCVWVYVFVRERHTHNLPHSHTHTHTPHKHTHTAKGLNSTSASPPVFSYWLFTHRQTHQQSSSARGNQTRQRRFCAEGGWLRVQVTVSIRDVPEIKEAFAAAQVSKH